MATCDTVNVWSAVQDFIAYPATAPGWADITQGYAYALSLFNPTGSPITDGVVTFLGACASPDNPCIPDTFEPLDPVAGCTPIVSGVPETGPVTVTITPERAIGAYGECKYAVPCPKPFMRVELSGGVADCFATIVVTHLRRTDFSHVGPTGGIYPPLQQPFQLGSQQYALPAPQLAPAPAPQPAPASHLASAPPTSPQPARAPAPQQPAAQRVRTDEAA